MAHIGRPGPYLFRRDWNLNVDNNFYGFPRRYILTFGHASFLTGRKFDLGPDRLSSANTMGWFSEPRTIGPFSWQVAALMQINADGQTYRKYFQVIDFVTAAVVLQWRTEGSERAPGLSPWTPFLEVEDPVYFPAGANLGEITVFNKTWSDGPPH